MFFFVHYGLGEIKCCETVIELTTLINLIISHYLRIHMCTICADFSSHHSYVLVLVCIGDQHVFMGSNCVGPGQDINDGYL